MPTFLTEDDFRIRASIEDLEAKLLQRRTYAAEAIKLESIKSEQYALPDLAPLYAATLIGLVRRTFRAEGWQDCSYRGSKRFIKVKMALGRAHGPQYEMQQALERALATVVTHFKVDVLPVDVSEYENFDCRGGHPIGSTRFYDAELIIFD